MSSALAIRLTAAASLAALLGIAGLACQPSGGGGSSTPPQGAPRITSIDPSHGPSGATVTIAGSSFETDRSLDSVFFGGAQASVLSASTVEAVCRVPSGAGTGRVSVTLSTRGGTSNALDFTIDAAGGGVSAPSISIVSPSSGPVGTAVVISGGGFDTSAAGNIVTFNGTQAAVAAATATRIDATVPPGATSGRVVVQTGSGSSNGVTFTVTSTQPANQGQSGSMARDYLAAVPYSSMLVEVDYIQGAEPDQQALNFLKTRLDERCNKPGGITIQVDDAIPSPGITTWRLQDVASVERQHRDSYHGGNTAVLYVLYVNGGYETDTSNAKVLGISYTGSSFCMFKDSMRGSVTVLVTGQVIERAVLVHEAGHNLGLVNNGIPMQSGHQDSAHGAHSNNQNCVMYWAVESSLVSQLLGSIPNQFDAACIADMQAVGGK